jgi:hypothetical protein
MEDIFEPVHEVVDISVQKGHADGVRWAWHNGCTGNEPTHGLGSRATNSTLRLERMQGWHGNGIRRRQGAGTAERI